MTRRRTLLILLGTLQLIAFTAGWLPYFFYGVKSGEYHANEAFDQIRGDLDNAALLVQPRTQQQDTELWLLGSRPIVAEIHRARGVAFWPLVGLGLGGPIVLALGLMPDRGRARSHEQPSDPTRQH
jgi:hypothetical protein